MDKKKTSDPAFLSYCANRYGDQPRLVLLLTYALDGKLKPEEMAEPTFDATMDHIADWLKGAMERKEPWLKPYYIGDNGEPTYPKRLYDYIHCLKHATNEADKDMKWESERLRGLVSLGIDEEEIMKFPNGYRIVRLTSPLALDAESAYMRHCIGQGGYDHHFENNDCAFYSLRDASNKPHATFQVETKKNRLVQLQGKANKPPVAKYMPYVVDFVRDKKFDLQVTVNQCGLLKQHGTVYSVYHLPEGFVYEPPWDGSKPKLNLEGLPIAHLPKNFRVGGSLDIEGTLIEHLPKGLHVTEDLSIGSCPVKTLGARTFVGKGFYVANATFEGVPEDANLRGSISISKQTVREQVGHVEKREKLPNRPFAPLPATLKHSKRMDLQHIAELSLLPGMQVEDALQVFNCDHVVVPRGIYTAQWFDMRWIDALEIEDHVTIIGICNLECPSLTKLPEYFTVDGDLDLSKTSVTTLPKTLHVTGSIKSSPAMIQSGADEVVYHASRAISPQNILAQRKAVWATQR